MCVSAVFWLPPSFYAQLVTHALGLGSTRAIDAGVIDRFGLLSMRFGLPRPKTRKASSLATLAISGRRVYSVITV